jgi:hypothetical protein
MKLTFKSALAAAAMAGVIIPSMASAQVGVSVGVGGSDVSVGVGAPVFDANTYGPCGPDYAPCGAQYNPYEGETYYDPIFFGGEWYHGPYRWRRGNDGHAEFFVNGGWHHNEWRGRAYPASISFSNGGYYRGGRYDGWDGADRINARYHPDAAREERSRDH